MSEPKSGDARSVEHSVTTGLADAIRRARAEAFEECARIAAMHVCRLAPLPCDGLSVAGQECGCITSNRIADEIRRRAKP